MARLKSCPFTHLRPARVFHRAEKSCPVMKRVDLVYISRLRIRSKACWVAKSLTLARSPRKFFPMHSILLPSLRAM